MYFRCCVIIRAPVNVCIVKFHCYTHFEQHVAASTGTGAGDLQKLKEILDAVPDIKYICVDVANGYSEHFVQFVRDCRKEFPKHTIMVSTTVSWHWGEK